MTNKVISEAPQRCTGCRLCEQWCAYAHGLPTSPSNTRVQVRRIHHAYLTYPVVCHQCDSPACIGACKFDALSRDKATGAIRVDEAKCRGCSLCAKACPHGAVVYDPQARKVRICDLCGGAPQCVAHCPERVLAYRNGSIDTE